MGERVWGGCEGMRSMPKTDIGRCREMALAGVPCRLYVRGAGRLCTVSRDHARASTADDFVFVHGDAHLRDRYFGEAGGACLPSKGGGGAALGGRSGTLAS